MRRGLAEGVAAVPAAATEKPFRRMRATFPKWDSKRFLDKLEMT